MDGKLIGKWRGLLQRFRRNESGVTAIEFAMVGGPFLYLLLVIFETSIMLFSENAIENGVAQAARQIRTGQAQNSGMSQAGFKTLVCSNVPAYLSCSSKLIVDVRKFATFAAVTLPPALDGAGNLNPSLNGGGAYMSSGPMEVVVVRTYYPYTLSVPGISMLANYGSNSRLLTAGAAFRNEPYTAP
jgi:Flp pilus assembly protein TadG